MQRHSFLLAFLLSLAATLAVLEAAPVDQPAVSSVASVASARQGDDLVDPGEILEDARDKAARIFSTYGDVIFGVMIPLGLILAMAGYRFLKPTIFIAGFLVGGFFVSSIVYRATRSEAAGAWAPIVSFFVAGLIIGVLAVFLSNFGIFLAGAALGVAVAFATRTTFASVSTVSSVWGFALYVAVLAIGLGVLTLCLKKPMVILATAFAGSYGFVYGIARFAGNYPAASEFLTEDQMQLDWKVWLILGAWLALSAIGIVVQFTVTSKKCEKDVESFKNTRKNGVMPA